MLILIFISSGLFLGWSLGANDAANIFGTAVGSRMIKFSKAALIAGIFVILGAVLQGTGTTNTLSELGSVDAVGGAFTVALCSGLIVAIMTRFKLPVSTGQAIVGAIMGWCYFTANPVDYSVLSVIVGSWISGPILGAIFSALLYMLLRRYIRRSHIHLLKLDTVIRNGLIIAGAFGAYSLGANNIANVMGVFVKTISFEINIGSFSFSSITVLFLLGGISIAIGILTYSKKVMETIGTGILAMTPESAIVVVLAQALVLFIFSSTSLSNLFVSIGLPAIPMVPVSSTQVVVGSVLGIGLVKGVQEIKFKMIRNIIAGWILTPILSGVTTFFSLFFIQSVFGISVTKKNIAGSVLEPGPVKSSSINVPLETVNILIIVLLFLLLITIVILFYRYQRNRLKLRENEKRWTELVNYTDIRKSLSDMEVSTIQLENDSLVTRLEERKRELITYSLSIGEQRQLLSSISRTLESAINIQDPKEKNEMLMAEIRRIKQKMSFTNEVERIYTQAEHVYADFSNRLVQKFPNLTVQDRRLMMLLRIGFSSKEIAPILNISVKSVEISRHRLRKKLNLSQDENLVEFVKTA
ncbi:MAG: inorganic phosphate transporter [Bacteroidetes bacterium HGW-Bacteroidetes-5]|jgi:phosphate/sulfate permease/DNA-binding NarL/FixJ family response regulator|nr:MAG: inorganic phosphate transporter [Bacteroidetes bacterium HGW-Bacteroidetes-5]